MLPVRPLANSPNLLLLEDCDEHYLQSMGLLCNFMHLVEPKLYANVKARDPMIGHCTGAPGPSWPMAASSMGRSVATAGMGTSPYGKSVDMVDVCAQLMDSGAPSLSLSIKCCIIYLPFELCISQYHF